MIEVLAKAGQAEYTLIRDVAGRGKSGERGGDQVSGVFSNSYIIAVCSLADVDAVLRAVKPQIKRFGGICLVSPAEMLKHWE